MYSPKLQEQAETLFEYHRNINGFYGEVAKSMGLTLASLLVLHIISQNNNCTQKTITDKTYLPKQTVNVIIKNFKDKGIIASPVKSPYDKRNKVLAFTKEGKIYAERIIDKVKEFEYRALSSLGEEKTEILIDIIKIYRENLKH